MPDSAVKINSEAIKKNFPTHVSLVKVQSLSFMSSVKVSNL